jgi:hypothetical protein
MSWVVMVMSNSSSACFNARQFDPELEGRSVYPCRKPTAGGLDPVLSWLTVRPPAGTSSRTVIEYDTEGAALIAAPPVPPARRPRPADC